MAGHSRKKVDLTGQRYGQLTVLAPAENIGSRTAWLCRCDCGKEVVVKTNRLRSGHTKSCGCQRPGKGLNALTYIDGTCVEMLAARTVRSNNTSGVPGVDWMPKKHRWRASICFKGKRRYLGSYENLRMRQRPGNRRRKNCSIISCARMPERYRKASCGIWKRSARPGSGTTAASGWT